MRQPIMIQTEPWIVIETVRLFDHAPPSTHSHDRMLLAAASTRDTPSLSGSTRLCVSEIFAKVSQGTRDCQKSLFTCARWSFSAFLVQRKTRPDTSQKMLRSVQKFHLRI